MLFILIRFLRPLLRLAACSAGAQLAAEATRTRSPYFVVSGAVPGVDALPLKSARADVTVSGVIADAAATQVYRNEGTTPIEARYVFLVSTRAGNPRAGVRVARRAGGWSDVVDASALATPAAGARCMTHR